jgi:ATP-dependent DNA helicase RecQ
VDGAHKHEDIHAVLRKYWGYEAFRPVQEDVVRSVMAGRDTLALLPTGGGKSLCFQVPALAMGRMCLVISPLIALIKDQVQRLRRMGIPARAITSDMGRAEIENALENAVHGKVPLLYVSPERLSSDLFEARLPRMPLGLIAVDEAHCISQWGYDFRPAYMQVQEMRLRVPGVPVLALTASATAQVAADIMEKLAFPAPNVIRGRFHRPELVLWVSRGEDKNGRLLRIMHHVEGSAIVYLRRRRATVQMAQFMRHHGITAEAYHAGLPPAERDRIQKEWTEGRIRCVAATNAFGMGIDKSDVRVVVHTDLPRAITKKPDAPDVTAGPRSPSCSWALAMNVNCASGWRHPSLPLPMCAACTKPSPTCTASPWDRDCWNNTRSTSRPSPHARPCRSPRWRTR